MSCMLSSKLSISARAPLPTASGGITTQPRLSSTRLIVTCAKWQGMILIERLTQHARAPGRALTSLTCHAEWALAGKSGVRSRVHSRFFARQGVDIPALTQARACAQSESPKSKCQLENLKEKNPENVVLRGHLSLDGHAGQAPLRGNSK